MCLEEMKTPVRATVKRSAHKCNALPLHIGHVKFYVANSIYEGK